jgi:hypothetical protein
MRRITAGGAILVAIYVSACSGSSASDDDDDGGSGGDDGSGKGGTGGATGGTGNVGGGSVGGTGGGSAGPSGLPSSAYLDELTPDELHDLCAWGVPLEGGPGEKQCDSSSSVTTPTVEECSVDMVTIHCTVGLLESCVLSLDGDACALLTSAACAAYVDCALGN